MKYISYYCDIYLACCKLHDDLLRLTTSMGSLILMTLIQPPHLIFHQMFNPYIAKCLISTISNQILTRLNLYQLNNLPLGHQCNKVATLQFIGANWTVESSSRGFMLVLKKVIDEFTFVIYDCSRNEGKTSSASTLFLLNYEQTIVISFIRSVSLSRSEMRRDSTLGHVCPFQFHVYV